MVTIQLPITLSPSPVQRACAVVSHLLSLAGAWGALHDVAAGSWDPLFGIVVCVVLVEAGIRYGVSSITIDQDHIAQVGAWRIETVLLSSSVEVRPRQDMVELVGHHRSGQGHRPTGRPRQHHAEPRAPRRRHRCWRRHCCARGSPHRARPAVPDA